MNQSRSLASILVILLPIALVAGLIWANYRFARLDVAGEGFSIQWISIQSLAKSGTNPYSDEVTERIRVSVPRDDAFILKNYPKYTSPLYSGIVIFPLTFFGDKNLAHAIWMTAQLVLIFGMLLLCLRITSWKPAWFGFFIFSLLTVFSYHVAMPWLDGGLPIWSAFFMVVALLTIQTNRYEVGGFFLALASIQPQMTILSIIFILIWSISKKKTVLLLWFFITLILLSAIGLFLVPGWILQYLRLLYNFTSNFPAGSLGLFFSIALPGLGSRLGWITTGLFALILLLEWFLALRKDFRWFLWTVCLTMVVSQWIGIPTTPANFIHLVLPLFFIFAMLSERWLHGGVWAAVGVSLLMFVWEWGLYYLDFMQPRLTSQLNLIFPLPAILIIGLYWVRWWAIKPRRLLIEEIRLSETY